MGMEEINKILQHYRIGDTELIDYKAHSHDPDMWSHTFTANDKNYLVVEVEALNDDLQDEEYSRIEDDLGISKARMKLVLPKLQQIQTVNNRAGIGVDGHKTFIDADEAKELWEAQTKAQASRYFPPVTDNELPDWNPKKYKNPDALDTDTTWVLFELE